MDKISTQPKVSNSPATTKDQTPVKGPRKATLDFLRQFARVYVPTEIDGVVLN